MYIKIVFRSYLVLLNIGLIWYYKYISCNYVVVEEFMILDESDEFFSIRIIRLGKYNGMYLLGIL